MNLLPSMNKFKDLNERSELLIPLAVGITIGVVLTLVLTGDRVKKIRTSLTNSFKQNNDDDPLFEMDNASIPWAMPNASFKDLDEYNIQPS